jgi:hypothetical protein
VILDTSPGLDRMSLEVLTASIGVAGSKVFVLRPRPVDIALLCFEDDWIYGKPELGGAYAVVLNFSLGGETINMDDSVAIANELVKWDQFFAYSNRFSTNDISEDIRTMVQKNWPKFRHEEMHFTGGLTQAGNLRGPSLINAIRNTSETIKDAKRILDGLRNGYVPRRGS